MNQSMLFDDVENKVIVFHLSKGLNSMGLLKNEVDALKIKRIKMVIDVAVLEVLSYKSMPEADLEDDDPCYDFLSLVHQYAQSFASKSEVRIVLEGCLDEQFPATKDSALKATLLQYLENSQILGE